MNFLNNNFNRIISFIKHIRHIGAKDDVQFNELLQELLVRKSVDEEFKRELTEFVFLLLDNAFFVNAFADYGINSSQGFFPEVSKRIKHKLLPANLPDNELSHFIIYLFDKPSDYIWIEKINFSGWEAIAKLVSVDDLSSHSEKLTQQIHNAIIILCHRLTSIGIEPYLVNRLPKIDDSDSPFFELNHQVSLFVKKHYDDRTLEIREEELQVVIKSIERVEALFNELQFKRDEMGTSLHLTFLLKRAQQHIDRIRLLLDLFVTKQSSNRVLTTSLLIKALVKAEHTKNSVLKFITDNTSIMAYRIVSHTSQKGEHYIGFSKKENQKLFLSAMGGGLIVVLLVYIKQLIHHLHVSLFFEGFLFGLNYAIGFVLMHLMHLTLATKQPAMTASYIAENIGNGKESISKAWDVFKQIIRSQFVSLLGNLVIVVPICYGATRLIYYYFNYSVFDNDEARTAMYSNHPFYSASLIYACITGFFLSLSGIVIGYIDNKVVYSEIAERIIKHPKLLKIYSLDKRKKLAGFTERNGGAIIGNIFLGFCLGMAGNIGKFIGVPFDIRHVTISGGNFGIAIGGRQNFTLDIILTVFLGVLIIGAINIASSFLISFIVACRSRNLSWKQSLKILVGFSI